MAVTVTIVAAVLLTLAVFAFSRWGTSDHQENLNDHASPAHPAGGTVDELEPKADRPAGPGAEPTRAEVGDAVPDEPQPGRPTR